MTFLGINSPAINNAHDARAAIVKPGKKEPDTSRKAPTNMGAKNMANPENVRNEPQITATFSGVMLFICMGSVSRVGTYSHDPIPMTITAG